MPALNERRAAKATGEKHGGILLRALGIDLIIEQRHGLGNVGRDDGRQRECLSGILGNEASTRGGDHDGVDDDILCVPGAQAVGDNLDNLGRGDHADLDGAGSYIVKNGIDLRCDNIRGDVLHGGNAQCVLRCDGGDGRLGI